MVWSQSSIKTLGLHFGSSVLDNSDWEKISHSLTKDVTHFGMKKKTKELQTKSSSLDFSIGQIYTISKFIKEEIEKAIAQISNWKCGLGILDVDTLLKSLELKWI